MVTSEVFLDMRNAANTRANALYGLQDDGSFLVRSTGARVVETPVGTDLVFGSRSRANRFLYDLVFRVHRDANLLDVVGRLGRGGSGLTADLAQFFTNPSTESRIPKREGTLHFQPGQVRKSEDNTGLVFASTDLAVGTLLDLLPVASAFGIRESSWMRDRLTSDLHLDFRRDDRRALLDAIHKSNRRRNAKKRAWEAVHWVGVQAFADGAY